LKGAFVILYGGSMKKGQVFFGIIVLLAALTFFGCPDMTNSISDAVVGFIGVSAVGPEAGTTTALRLTFNKDILGLTAADIVLESGSTGAQKGSVTHISTGVYELTLSGISAGGMVNIAIYKSGYAITPGQKSAQIFFSETGVVAVDFTSVTANGTVTTATTSKLTLVFSQDISGLTADDIMFADIGTTGAQKGTLSKIDEQIGEYELALSGISATGNVRIAVSKAGYNISGSPKETAVFYYQPGAMAVSFNNLTANGSATAATTELYLVFSQDISGLAASDIALSPNTISKGTLNSTGAGTYTLPVSNISATGNITVTVSKDNYNISGNPKQTAVYYLQQVSFTGLTADGSVTTATTSKLTLSFSPDIIGLTADDITLTDIGATGAQKGSLTSIASGIYELALSGISATGNILVAVSKTSYNIDDSQREITVYHYQPGATAVNFNNLTANGSTTVATTALYLVFSQDISGLTEADIALNPSTINKGVLSKTGTGTYTLPVSNVSATGTVSVTVTKAGYNISGSPKNVTVYQLIQRFFTGLSANGTSYASTSELYLVFDQDIEGLAAADITLNPSSINKLALNRTGTGAYTLGVSGISADGTVIVTAAKAGYNINGSQSTMVRYAQPINFTLLTADGSNVTTSTTKLILSFSMDIGGLEASDITLTDTGSTGAQKGTLTKISGQTGKYELALSNISTSGTVSVTVSRTGYDITGNPKNVTIYHVVPALFTGLSANGNLYASTTELYLSFDQDIEGLAAADIIISPSSITKGVPNKTGTGTYTLGVSNISANGTVNVTVSKAGYGISGSQSTTVRYAQPVSFASLAADGSLVTTTAKLTLTVNPDISLEAADITLTDTGSTGAQRGSLTQISSGVYELALSNISTTGTVSVTVSKVGFNINPGSRNATVRYAIPAAFTGLSANGTSYVSTSELYLIFDQDIEGLAANDITLSPGSISKGTVTKTGTGTYTLGVSSISANGTVSATAAKAGYNISGSQSTPVHYAEPVSFTGLTADGSAATVTTTKLTLNFDKNISGLTADDITLTDTGSTGAQKGSLTPISSGVYELSLSNISATGTVSVTVLPKAGYNISGSPRNVVVYNVVQASFNSLAANGSVTSATTQLTLTFNKDIEGLAESDITLSPSAITKGTLNKTGTGTYTLGVSDIPGDITASVSVSRTGYNISGGTRTVPVYVTPVFVSLTADGSLDGAQTATTTKLTLTFNKVLDGGLVNSNITFVAGTTQAIEGTVSHKGNGVYELPLSNVKADGQVTVYVSKPGLVDNKTANIYLAPAFVTLTANGSITATTTELTMTFNKDISGLTASDIILTGGSTGTQKGSLSQSGNEYKLTVSNVNATGTITVAVLKSGFMFNKTVGVTKATSGTVPIDLELQLNESGSLALTATGGTASSGDVYVIDRSDNENITVSLGSGLNLIEWSVPGSTIGGTSGPITVNAVQLSAGNGYRISVVVSKDGAYYSTEIPFNVTN
jgi:hypothetical protein